MYRKIVLEILGFSLIMVSCGMTQPSIDESQDNKSVPAIMVTDNNQDLQKLIADNNQFAFDLYGQLKNNSGNLFFSPYSISTALAMTYAGSRNNTEKEMAQVMRYTLEQNKLHSAFSRLQVGLTEIQKKGDVKLAVTNALWPHINYKFLPEYIELNRRFYGAKITNLDYVNSTEAARLTINDWVDNKTSGKIKDLIAPDILDPLTRLVLTNAIYFKGDWAEKFNKELTKPIKFSLSKTEQKDVQTMFQKGEFNYQDAETVKVLELPYKGNDLSMIVILPKEIDGLTSLEKSLTAEQVAKWTSNLKKMKVNVFLPKFSITSQFGLSDTLKQMGMKDAFTFAADFSGMDGTTDLMITAILHKAFVAVDEEGTEAAAATAVVVGIKSMPMFEEFRADHPFFFLIRENASGSILFLGRVADPA